MKVHAKRLAWFHVPTPPGTYNPDWVVLVEKDGAEQLYFVVETKPTQFTRELRGKEQPKVECGRAHFAALADGDNPARYVVASSLDEVMANV